MTLRNVMKETLHCREELPLYLTVCVGEQGRLAAPPQPCLHTPLYPRHCGLPADPAGCLNAGLPLAEGYCRSDQKDR